MLTEMQASPLPLAAALFNWFATDPLAKLYSGPSKSATFEGASSSHSVIEKPLATIVAISLWSLL
jgi:hypothetical protein